MSDLKPLHDLIAEWRSKSKAAKEIKEETYQELKAMEPFNPNRPFRANTYVQMVVIEDDWERAANALERTLRELEGSR